MATITQPLHCDLQPHVAKHPLNPRAQTHPKQLEASLQRGKKNIKTIVAATVDEVPFIADSSHSTRKSTMLRSAASAPTSLMQHSCCHPTAICNPRFKRPQQDPKKHQNERPATAVNTGCPSSPTAATSTEKHTVSRSGLLPSTSPM